MPACCAEQVPYYQPGMHPMEGGEFLHPAGLYDEKKSEQDPRLCYAEEGLGQEYGSGTEAPPELIVCDGGPDCIYNRMYQEQREAEAQGLIY